MGSIPFGEGGSASDAQVPTLPDVGFDGVGADDDTEAAFDIGKYNVLATLDLGMASVSVSAHVDDDDSTSVDDLSVAASFDVGGVKVGVGFEDVGGTEVIALGVSGEAAGVGYNVFWHQADNGATVSTVGVAGTFDIDDMTSVTAVIGMNEDVSSHNDFAVGIARSLGGGVSFKAGVGSINDETVADAGFTFDF